MRTFELELAFEDGTLTIDDHHVAETRRRARPDGPPATETREYDLKPGHVDAYVREVLERHGWREVTS